MHFRLLAATVLTLALVGAALAPGAGAATPDAPNGAYSGLGLNGGVSAAAQQGDLLYLGGDFSRVGSTQVGTTPTFTHAGALAGSQLSQAGGTGSTDVSQIEADGAGGYFVSGSFDEYGGVAVQGLAHVLANGTTDPSFAPSLPANSFFATALEYDDGSDLLYVGYVSLVGTAVVAYDPADGSVDAAHSITLAVGFTFVDDLELAGGFLYIAGAGVNSGTLHGLMRAATSGNTIDATWDLGLVTDDSVRAIAIDSGTIYLGMYLDQAGDPVPRVRSVDIADASVNWEAYADGGISDFYVDNTNGNIYVAGSFEHLGDVDDVQRNLGTLTGGGETGNPVASPNGEVFDIAASDDGDTLYLAGAFTSVGSTPRNKLAEIVLQDRTLTAFDPDGGLADNASMNVVVPTATAVVAGGTQARWGGTRRNGLLAIDTSTDALASLPVNPSVNGRVWELAIAGSRLFAAGQFTRAGATNATRDKVAAFSLTSGNVLGWAPNPTGGSVNSLHATADRIYVGGNFEEADGVAREGIAAWTLDDLALVDWSPETNGTVTAIASDDTYLYIGGNINHVAGVTRNAIARFVRATGALDPTWNPDLRNGVSGSGVRDISLTPTAAYVSGEIATINNVAVTSQGLGAIGLTGTGVGSPFGQPLTGGQAIGWNSGLSGDRVFVCGSFTTIAGATLENLAQVTVPEGTATSWMPTSNTAAGCYYARALGPDSLLTYGGDGVRVYTAAPRVGTATSGTPTATGVAISAPVTANGSRAAISVQYGTTAAYGSTTAGVPVAATSIDAATSTELTGLAPATTYHARVVATSNWGTTQGTDITFTTAAAPVTITPDTTPPAMNVTLAAKVSFTRKQPKVPIRLSCPATETTCSYIITATFKAGGKTVIAGTAAATLTGGASTTVQLKLTKAAVKLPAGKGRKVTFLTKVTDAAKNAASASKLVTLTLKK